MKTNFLFLGWDAVFIGYVLPEVWFTGVSLCWDEPALLGMTYVSTECVEGLSEVEL